MTRQGKKKRDEGYSYSMSLHSHGTCIPKDNPLLKQKTDMCNHLFLHLNDKLISEFHTRWVELNNYLNEFPPFQPNQHFTEDQTKDILYNIIPKH
jgi:hypothetical protein